MGVRISARRLKRSASKRLGVKGKAIHDALTGKWEPEFETVAMIAGALDVPAWALMIDGLRDHPELLTVGGPKSFEQRLASTPGRRVAIEKAANAPLPR